MSGTRPPIAITLTKHSMVNILAIALLGFTLFAAREIVINILLAGVFASALYPPVQFLQNTLHWPRKVAILALYALFVLVVLGMAYMLTSVILDQAQALIDAAPRYANTLQRLFNTLPYVSHQQSLVEMAYQQMQTGTNQAMGIVTSAFSRFKLAANGLVNIIVMLVLAFFLLSDNNYFHWALLRVVPPSAHQRVSSMAVALANKVGQYARGQLIVMLCVGVMTWLGLSAIGVPYAFLLGLIAFLLDIIPLMGPVLAFVVGGLVTLGYDPQLFGWTALLYLVVQQLENYILVPNVLGKSVGLHSAWIFISILVGGSLLGISGVILAVPFAVFISLCIEIVFPKKDNQNLVSIKQ